MKEYQGIESNNSTDLVDGSPKSPSIKLIKKLSLILLEPIPRPLGVVLRRMLYPFFIKQVGNKLYTQAGVELLGFDQIEIGNNVTILRYALLNCDFKDSRLIIGNNVVLDRGVNVRLGDNCTIEIGEDSFLGANSCVAGPGPVKIGRNCLIAAMTGIFANQHHHVGDRAVGITIEDECWIGSGAKILDGVTIGYGSVIGAGAVVTKDIPPYSIAVGVPAKVIEGRKTLVD